MDLSWKQLIIKAIIIVFFFFFRSLKFRFLNFWWCKIFELHFFKGIFECSAIISDSHKYDLEKNSIFWSAAQNNDRN